MEVTTMDSLCEKIVLAQEEISYLEDVIEEKKQAIAAIKKQVEEYFIATDRDAPYVSPNGTLYLASDLSIKQPKGDALKALFTHFCRVYGEELAWTKMSIHNQTLKSEVKEHITAVETRGGDPILESLPGVEQPTYFKQLRFRKSKGKS